MRILISTTTNWNPGDDFIRFGVQNLLGNHTYIHYDRNPIFYESYPLPTRRFLPDWSIIDAVVLAGSPEWLHGPLEHIYRTIPDHIPLYAIGVGYTFHNLHHPLTENEIRVLKRSTIICRQKILASYLETFLEKKIWTLPCPAIFSVKEPSIKTKQTVVIGQIPGDDFTNKDYIRTIRKARNLPVICHTLKDYKFWSATHKCFYSPDPHILLNEICQYENVITNRLHGGLVALSNGSKVDFVNSSYRCNAALEMFDYFKDIQHWKKLMKDKYKFILGDLVLE